MAVNVKKMADNKISENRKFSIKKRLYSFRHALNGLKILIKEEHNARIHIGATVLVIIAGFLFKISPLEWIAVIFATGLVFASEILNTSIENLADFVSPDIQNRIKKVKDLAASGVLVSAITALLVGLFIFLPKIVLLF